MSEMPGRTRLSTPAIGFFLTLLASCSGDVGSPGAARLGSSDGSFDRALGERTFRACCAACHGEDGTGQAFAGSENTPPPLDRAPWVAGDPGRLVRIVLHGLHGPIEIDGRTHDLQMPGFGRVLDDARIAAVLSYVRERFADAGPVPVDLVRETRAEHILRSGYWHVRELEDSP